MASTGKARCTTLSREGVLSENLLSTSNTRRRPASHHGVSTVVATRTVLAESSSSPTTSRWNFADPTIADQTRDRHRTRGVDPRASTPRPPHAEGKGTHRCGLGSADHGHPRPKGPLDRRPKTRWSRGPPLEAAPGLGGARATADSSSVVAPMSPPAWPARRMERTANVLPAVVVPAEASTATMLRSSRLSAPRQDRGSSTGTEVPARHADCPATRPPRIDHGVRPGVATETSRVPLQTMPPRLRPRLGRDGSEDPPTARRRSGADSGRKRPSSGNTPLERRHSCRRSTPGKRWTLRPDTRPRRALARGGARKHLLDYDTVMERNHGRQAIPCHPALSVSPPTVPALPRVEALPRRTRARYRMCHQLFMSTTPCVATRRRPISCTPPESGVQATCERAWPRRRAHPATTELVGVSEASPPGTCKGWKSVPCRLASTRSGVSRPSPRKLRGNARPRRGRRRR
jgi:hypothetical protein